MYLRSVAPTGRVSEPAGSIYSIVGTARLNDVDPEAHLRCALERIAEHGIDRIHELQPWNLGAQLSSLRTVA